MTALCLNGEYVYDFGIHNVVSEVGMIIRLVWSGFQWIAVITVFGLTDFFWEPNRPWYTERKESLKKWPNTIGRSLYSGATKVFNIRLLTTILALAVVGTLLYIVWQPLVLDLLEVDLPQVPVDTATLATLVGIIIAILALGIAAFGIFMRELLGREIKDETAMGDIRSRGSLQNWISYSHAVMYQSQLSGIGKKAIPADIEPHVNLGKEMARNALRLANESNDEELKLYAQNNLAYHIGTKSESPKETREALQMGETVSEASKRYNRRTWKETYAWVLWRLGSDSKSQDKAKRIVTSLLDDPTISDEQKDRWRLIYKELLD